MKELSYSGGARRRANSIANIQLNHGQALWVLSRLGFRGGVTETTFNYYIKSLRKLGVPFARGELGHGTGNLVKYSYNHLMELSVALTLRMYSTLPYPVVVGLIRFRKELHAIYRRAYLESTSGIGAPVLVKARGRGGFRMNGVYLDLQLKYSGGRLAGLGPPKALAPFEALALFAGTDMPARAHLPVNLTALATNVVQTAHDAPNIRRGPRFNTSSQSIETASSDRHK